MRNQFRYTHLHQTIILSISPQFFGITYLVPPALVHLSHIIISSGNSLNDECVSSLVSLGMIYSKAHRFCQCLLKQYSHRFYSMLDVHAFTFSIFEERRTVDVEGGYYATLCSTSDLLKDEV
jgi:hypothetical protein